MRAALSNRDVNEKPRRGLGLLVLLGFALVIGTSARGEPPPDKIADVVAKVQGAVVRIITVLPPKNPPSAGVTAASANDPDSNTEFGSGFIIDPSGLVATNRHVVENATAVFVGTPDGGRYQAETIITAGETDIALLRITPRKTLPATTFGDSDTARVGDTVIVIGDPFGFAGSVTAGIVSATNRNIMEGPFDEYIQTDAAINHGNSGGPMFNLSGQVIGMASVLFAPGTYSGSAGVGFGIPSNLVSFVLGRLDQSGKVSAGMLPLRTQSVPEMMAAAIGAPGPGGALVIELTDQAEAMGGLIQPGDVIHAFAGTLVLDPRDLARKALRAKVGSPVALQVYRAGQLLSVEVPVVAYAGRRPTVRQTTPAKSLGLQLVASSGADNQPGVTVESVDPSGSVADSGLRKGDVIVRVQQRTVATPQQALDELQAWTDAKHTYAALLVQRDKKLSWMPVALPN